MRRPTVRAAAVLAAVLAALAVALPAAAASGGDAAAASGPGAAPPATPSAPATGSAPVGAGLVIRLEPGFTIWHLSAKTLEPQVGSRAGEIPSLMVGETRNAFGMTLGLGYDIEGQVTVGVELTGTGWNLGSSTRGGAGFATFTAAWHPAQTFYHPDHRRIWDVSIFLGAGWGVVGEDRAMRGLVLTTGLRAEAYLTRWLSVGATLRWNPLFYSRYVIDWNAGQGVDLPKGSGGSALVPAFTVAIHAPVGTR